MRPSVCLSVPFLILTRSLDGDRRASPLQTHSTEGSTVGYSRVHAISGGGISLRRAIPCCRAVLQLVARQIQAESVRLLVLDFNARHLSQHISTSGRKSNESAEDVDVQSYWIGFPRNNQHKMAAFVRFQPVRLFAGPSLSGTAFSARPSFFTAQNRPNPHLHMSIVSPQSSPRDISTRRALLLSSVCPARRSIDALWSC